MADRHIVTPNPFKEGDVTEWLQKFEICARANGWNAGVKAAKIPTLFEGLALMTYLEMSEDDKTDYDKIVLALTNEFVPAEARVQSLREFETRKQMPGESPHAYLFHLKKLLQTALPNLEEDTKETMLLQHFLDGIPKSIGQQLRAAPDIKTAHDAMLRARLLSAHADEVSQSAAVMPSRVPVGDEVIQRMDKLELMMTQLLEEQTLPETNAAVSQTPGRGRPTQRNDDQRSRRCYRCGRLGHIAKYCRIPKCYQCGRLGHDQERCSGNDRGLAARGGSVNH